MVLVFYLIMSFMGARVAKMRGEFILYLLSGVFPVSDPYQGGQRGCRCQAPATTR